MIAPPPDLERSLLELGGSVLALVFFTLRYAYSKVAAANLTVLDELKVEGLLSGDNRRDYRTLTRLIHTLSPAVTMRTEFWVGFYSVSMRSLAMLMFQKWANHQLSLLTAHQAGRYQIAINRLNALRSEA